MDPLTHTATGLFLSRAGLNRLTPRAAPILMLAANAPDIDILTTAGGPLNYLHYHRHLTHSLVALPVLAFLTVALVWAVSRGPVRWGGAWLAACIAVGSHLLLDLTNVYGIRLLLPFSGAWYRLDLNGLIDFWIWGAFLLGVAGPFLSRLVSSEISARKPVSATYGRGFAFFALGFLLLYDGGRALLHARAMETLDARLYQGAAPDRVVAIPGMNPLLWRGLVETGRFYEVAPLDLTGAFDPDSGIIFDKASPDPAIAAARRNSAFRQFLTFSQFPLWRVTPLSEPQGARQVEIFDMRFGTPVQPGFMIRGVLDAGGKMIQTSFRFGRPSPR
ncbi:MAG TPA: metal-dependent hydrolase [Bryobacteraceae bacterium]|nr:metal-dependent hydrolase [Bryobacteraceae bacterium]